MAENKPAWAEWEPILNARTDWNATIGHSIGGTFLPKIRVDTNVLAAKADQVDRLLNEMDRDFNELSQIIQRSASYWIGDAGNKYRADYKKQDAEVKDVLKRLRRFPTNLRQIAGVYSTTENQAQSTAASLPADIL